jgi:hypothetical protein
LGPALGGAQFAVENNREGVIEASDIDSALEEMLFSGGALNAPLLGIQAEKASV